jgi:hypothetical protein
VSYVEILLASHGTRGAQAAELLALSLCRPGGTLHHLWVVPELWRGMLGDDWLNSARTRIAFGEYLEGELAREVDQHQERLTRLTAERGLRYRPEMRQGDPAECLLGLLAERSHELLVIGSPRPKGEPGLRSRLALEPLIRALRAPLLIAPYPHPRD